MIVFSNNGAKVPTNVEAMVALVACLCKISPTIRWEKNSIGILMTFHIYEVEPIIAILPLIFNE